MTKKFDLTLEILREYMEQVRKEDYVPKTSIYEYILNNALKYELNPDEPFRIRLNNVDFSKEENEIDLSGANLSGVRFNNVIFSSNHLIIKNANLIGCRFFGSKFTGQISLKGTQFGPIALDKTLFEDVYIKEAKYDPTNPEAIMIPLTEQCLAEYFLSDPKINLNKFLNDRFGHRYKGRPLIADLSGVTIDPRFNEADISGSNLTRAKITGTITNLTMRDCLTCDTLFDDCHLIAPDIRGTSLANQGTLLANGFNPVNFGSSVTFESPKLSLNPNIDKLNGYSITLSQDISDTGIHTTTRGVSIEGETIFDPCYDKSSPDAVRISHKFSKEDLESYAQYTKATIGKKDDFLTYIKREKHITTDNIIADFSGLNLSGTDFSLGHFKNCDFSFTQLNGCNFRNTTLENCNFTRSTSSVSYLTSQRSIAYQAGQWMRNNLPTNSYLPPDILIKMDGATFRNCDLTWANFTKAHGEGVIFDNVTAINLNAPDLKFTRENSDNKTKSYIQNSNLSGAYLHGLQIDESEIDQSDFTAAQVSGTHLSKSKVTRSNFSRANFSKSQITESEFTQNYSDSHSNISDVTIAKSDLSRTKLAGKCTRMKVDDKTKTDDMDISELALGKETLGKLNLENAIDCDNNHLVQINQSQKELDDKRRKFYNRVGIAVLIGIVVISAAFPPLLGATLPAAIAAVAMPTIINVVTIGAYVVGIPVAMELMMRNFTPKIISAPISSTINKVDNWLNNKKNSANENEHNLNQVYNGPSIIRPIANFFGAERIINALNNKHIQKRELQQAELERRASQREQVAQQEKIVLARAIQRDRDIVSKKAKDQAKQVIRRSDSLDSNSPASSTRTQAASTASKSSRVRK